MPEGTEILVLEDYGKWKKVALKNDSGEITEGWTSSSLLKWKLGIKFQERFIQEHLPLE